tara:strand:- start:1909 stop:2790 length:882 start_codon:yes stop_codon:yes gene_type:complete
MEKKIVIIIPYRGIGDLIFHIPFFKGLYLKYKSKLIVFTNSANKAKNILRNEFYIKKIKYLNFQRENQIKNSYLLLKEINDIKSDLCILTASSKRLILPLLISNAKKKIFFKKENTKDLSQYIFKQSKKNFSNIQFKNNYALKFNKRINKKKVFISIDSHHDTNNWDENNYILLVKKMIKSPKFQNIYINFAPSKIKQFCQILNEFSNQKKISFTYNKNFDDIIKIINNSYYVIGNESGPICIAASLKKKIHSIYFPKYTNRSSKTIYRNVSFYNTNTIKPMDIISKILKRIH